MLMYMAVSGSGTFTSKHLGQIFREPSVFQNDPDNDLHVPSSSSHSSMFSPLDANSQAATVYYAFISALKSSFLSTLVIEEEYMHFGADSCIRFPRGGCSSTSTIDLPLGGRESKAQQLCLDIRWSLSGILTFSGHERSVPRLKKVSDLLQEGMTSVRTLSNVASPVILSPFGSHCEFAGLEDDMAKPPAGKLNKHFILALLSRLGIRLPTDIAWIRIQARSGQSRNCNPTSSRSSNGMCWPAQLAFIMPPPDRACSTQVLDKIADNIYIDPLAKAEQWFLGRDARLAAMKAKQKEEEDRKLEEIRLAESSFEPQADDEAALYHSARTDQYLSAQEASGIYPTPPDGLVSQMTTSSTHHDFNTVPTAEDHKTTAGGDAAARIRSSEVNSPDTDLSMHNFSKDEHQDLFGDMDAEMFDANDLTEADFNFFDDLDSKDVDAELECERSATSNLDKAQPIGENSNKDDLSLSDDYSVNGEMDIGESAHGSQSVTHRMS